LNKNDFIKEVATKADLTQKDAGKALDAILATIQETLAAGEKLQLVGFGSFEVRDRAERKIKSPATGEEMVIPATKAPAFKAGKALKEAVAPKPVVIVEAPKAQPAKKAKDKKKK
jgi:DNA-binding protein HU-beta